MEELFKGFNVSKILNGLVILCIKKKTIDKIDIDAIINDDFISINIRRKF